MSNSIITNFPITVYGKKEKFSETISKGRCKVFYKGRNRNNTYITPEFAEKLIASAPYTPVKGIYDTDYEDYTDHGKKRSEGRIYGVVPADPNFAWEKHFDSDGIEREYACFDVLYYTALYKEAQDIEGKSESMELYRESLKGEWKIIDGKKTYVFTEGCFLGLQALGDDVEPCFEGAGFYSKEKEPEINIFALLEKYEKRRDIFQNHEQGEKDNMPEINFKLSDNQKHNFLWDLLNPNFNEAGNYTVDCWICDVYDEYAVVQNRTEGIFERVYYTKNDNEDTLEITNRERCFIVDVNEAEKTSLTNIKGEHTYAEVENNIAIAANDIASLNETIGDLNTQISTLNETNENLTTENANYSTKVEELENSISTLTIERDEARENYDNANTMVNELTDKTNELTTELGNITAERDSLVAYKKNVENEAKRTVIYSYSEHLSEEVIENYLKNLDSYSLENLDKELTYEQKKANPTLFSAQTNSTPKYLPKDEGSNGINDILARFEKH